MNESELRPAWGGLRVADLSGRLSGAFAARLFADHGAQTTLVEPPEGHPLRCEGPFLEGRAGAERSALHAYLNWNKTSIVAETDADAAAVAADADLVITTGGSRWRGALSTLRSDAVHLSITPHGLTGPLADAPGNNLTLNARSGWAYVNALAEEPPLQLPPRQAGYVGALAGFVAAQAALRRRYQTDCAELVDVRELEALAHTVYPWTISAIYEASGRSYGAAGGRQRGEPGPLWDALDGKMNFGFGDWRSWPEAMELFNLPEQGARSDLQQRDGRYTQDLSEVFAGVARELASMERWPLFHRLAELRCISGCLQTISDLVKNEQLQARRFFVETEIEGQSVRASGNPAPMTPPSWSYRHAAPALNEQAPRETLSAPDGRPARTPQATPKGPLDGVRVLTFTQAWSGTFATELLSLLGADVVQIESLRRVDIWRSVRPWVPSAIRNNAIRQHPENTQGLFNAVNLNKRGIALDLGSDAGKDLFWRMLPRFDVVCENFRPGVLEGWGITLETLSQARPDIILAAISGYGVTGPYASYPANGATTEPMSGLSSLHGYEGDDGMNTAGLYPDPISGYTMTGALLAALQRRDATDGAIGAQRIDVSMMEAVGVVIGDAVVGFDATGELPLPLGNRDQTRAPQNIYPAAGENEWLALSVEDDAQWQSFCDLIGRAELADDPRYATAADRKHRETELDAVAESWLSERDAREAEAALLAAGVAAARVNPLYDLYAEPDPYLLETGFVQAVDHPEVGPSWLPGAPWRLSGATDDALRGSPCVGEHSREVLREELGIDNAEYDALVAQGVTGTLDDRDAEA